MSTTSQPFFSRKLLLTILKVCLKEGWVITDDPYVISYGERFLFVDLGATELELNNIEGQLIGAEQDNSRIALEIKDFRSQSVITDLERAIGQYSLYRLLLNKIDPEREIYLAITDIAYDEIFNEPIGKLVMSDLPLKLLVVDVEKIEVKQWIPPRNTLKSSNK